MTEQLRELGPLRWYENVIGANGHGEAVSALAAIAEADPVLEVAQ